MSAKQDDPTTPAGQVWEWLNGNEWIDNRFSELFEWFMALRPGRQLGALGLIAGVIVGIWAWRKLFGKK